ncbi:MAG TPA: acyltransferase, partial [Acidimicrobiales bacterium]|nr:acyltransferase [Acidimicrobiales bacterium]
MTETAIGSDTEVRLPFLDGIRAAAVVVVLLYHAGVPGVGGGLLGVDVFFVLSGFLITSLLCAEHATSGGLRLRRFWARRARRLLPALFILLLGVAAYARVFSGSVDGAAIRADALATLLYVANWHFIASSQGYFAQASASPLLHAWSLAVEEQYYLVWPLVAVLVLRRGGRRALGWVAGVGAAASASLMAVLYVVGVSTDRLYYGTDTRAQALLVGSLLGAAAGRPGWRAI